MTPLGKTRPCGGPKRSTVPGRGEALSLEHLTCTRLFRLSSLSQEDSGAFGGPEPLVVETNAANLGVMVQGPQ